MISRAGAARADARPVWVLAGQRAGDNAQLLALADALGWPYEVKRLAYRRSELVTNVLFDATLWGRVEARSSPLRPPWPDLVISAGRRSEPVARWIRRQAERPVKLVHVGRPWRGSKAFDLVVSTPQYPLEPDARVLRNPLPLHRVTDERLGAASSEWRTRLAHLPRPWIAVLVGGSSELFTLGAGAATRLAREASALARASKGSLLVTSSARTPRRAVDALCAAIDVPAEVFRWAPAARDNPYFGYLALADAFVVTGDSVSMLTEACATRKPVYVFAPRGTRGGRSADLAAAVRRRVFAFGIPRLARDIRRIHDELVGAGRAAFLGTPFAGGPPPPLDHLETTVARVRALLGDPGQPVAAPDRRDGSVRGHPLLPLEKEPSPPEERPRPARVWAILCYRAGDNSQILALAEALGRPFEIKRLEYRYGGRMLDLFRGTTLLGIRRRRSSPLAPPWPDLVISAAIRNEPVCRWIQRQSGGRTRYVHIGRPWARLANFDLVITVPELQVPRRPNVLHSAFSLHRVNAARLAEASRVWAPHVAHLPQPRVAVLVGGYSGKYALHRENAERLAREASAMARKHGGSLLVTTSARTPRAAIDALVRAIDVPHMVYRWRREDDANPYFGFLALADSIVVTCESASMLAEACATRKPVYMFDLGKRRAADGSALRPERGRLARAWRSVSVDRLRAFLYRELLIRFAPRRLSRDIGAVHEALLSSRRAVWLGQPFPDFVPPPLDEMPPALERVRALLAARAGGEAPCRSR